VNEQFRLLQLEIFVDESFLFVLLMVTTKKMINLSLSLKCLSFSTKCMQ